MKNLVSILIVLVIFSSCEKLSDHPEMNRLPGNPNTTFNQHILEGYFVKSIAFDSKGNAWIGTFNQGLIKYNSSETTIYNSENSSFPQDVVIWDVKVDSKDRVWIGTEGLVVFDGNEFREYNTQNSSIPEDFVYSIAIDSKDNIWFTSCRFRQGGIVKYDGVSWEVFTPENSEMPVNYTQSIAIDKNDKVWLALGEKVNNSYLSEIARVNFHTYTSEDLGFSPYYLSGIATNSYNEVCVGIDYSLSSCWYNPGPHVFVFDGHSSIQLVIDSTVSVNALTVDNEDNIWCTTGSGFAVYNWERWTKNDSMFFKSGTFDIVQAPDNRIWIGTGNGIYINE